jgi:mono/diheme cytochrome c family protein
MKYIQLMAGALALTGAALAQSNPVPAETVPVSIPPAAPFTAEAVEKGREQFHRTCAQCHGRNMVNAGTTVYDLRKFPTEQRERFYTSVTNGKGNMPSFKGALEPEAIELLWTYVATRGGKEL